MVTIIGKYFLLLLLIVSSKIYTTHVILNAASMNGEPLKTAGLGQPFILNVKILDFPGGSMAPVTIKNAEQFQLRSSGYQMRTINGNSELIYTYRIRIDQPGNYTLGPAEFNDGTKLVESNILTVSVAENQQLQENAVDGKKQQTSFARLLCDKKAVVIGQKVPCALRYYYLPQVAQFQQVITPENQDQANFSIKNQEGPFHGQETIQGTQYQYLEWRWQVYPRKQGNLVIPAYGIDFIPKEDRRLFFSFFTAQSKRIYSNSVSIQVNPLPGNQPVDAIGSFESFTATINPAVAKVGEGLVYTLSLSGDGDLEQLSLQLSNMPDSCKWYESKSSIHENMHNPKYHVKSFEYIIQPTTSGKIEIPSQSFSYFDTESRTYKKLTTHPLVIHALAVAQPKSEPQNGAATEPTETDLDIKTDIISHATNSWFSNRYALPFHWFIVLICMALLFYFFYHAQDTIKLLLARFSNFHQNAYKAAFVSLENAASNHNYAAIYPVFMAVLAAKAGCSPSAITSERIIELLVHAGASEKTIHDWQIFFAEISEQVFYQQNQEDGDDKLFEQARMWLTMLEKIL